MKLDHRKKMDAIGGADMSVVTDSKKQTLHTFSYLWALYFIDT